MSNQELYLEEKARIEGLIKREKQKLSESEPIVLRPNLIVFKWNCATYEHTLILNDPEMSITEINKAISEFEEDAYYAIYQKNYYDDEYKINAIIAGKNISSTTKFVGYTAFHTAKCIDGVWWWK
jgi:hypothetical protein